MPGKNIIAFVSNEFNWILVFVYSYAWKLIPKSGYFTPKITCIENHKNPRIITKMGRSDLLHCDFILIKKLPSIKNQKVRNPKMNWDYFVSAMFLAVHNDIGVKSGSLSTLSLKCASNEYQGNAEDLWGYYFPVSNLGCRGTTKWLPGVLAHFRGLYLT